MRLAIAYGLFSMAKAVLIIERLEPQMCKIHRFKKRRGQGFLWVDELELIAACLNKLGAGLGAYAQPVDSRWGGEGSVRFNSNGKAVRFDGFDQRWVELKEGLSPCEDDITMLVAFVIMSSTLPAGLKGGCQSFGS
ncbi:hypothetical protein AA15669_1230 [Saccharibacter floricola DSM 15669]|uniref:Uncharacterized protein n=1 Tax=Saccharibacter floricola DSM 15669 TaxID=1123227 RepID=A0ABQ0P2L1_9PROT|nr:hypothetical protein AA15669_1230 [Saccharibacter floricola DSM 15669]